MRILAAQVWEKKFRNEHIILGENSKYSFELRLFPQFIVIVFHTFDFDLYSVEKSFDVRIKDF